MAIARGPADQTLILKAKTGPIRARGHAQITSAFLLLFRCSDFGTISEQWPEMGPRVHLSRSIVYLDIQPPWHVWSCRKHQSRAPDDVAVQSCCDINILKWAKERLWDATRFHDINAIGSRLYARNRHRWCLCCKRLAPWQRRALSGRERSFWTASFFSQCETKLHVTHTWP